MPKTPKYAPSPSPMFSVFVHFIVRSSTKTKAKPRPTKSPSKKIKSSPFVDDEAAESDDGVLVGDPGPVPSNSTQAGQDEVDRANRTDEEYDQDFINDGDPFEDVDSLRYPSITPPPSPSKRGKQQQSVIRDITSSPEGTPPPSKSHHNVPETLRTPETPSQAKKVKKSSEVIEVTDTSDEDLATMDVDDSMFRKPAGVKASALPPSLLTRSAAAKQASVVPLPTRVSSAHRRPVSDQMQDAPSEEQSAAPAIVNGVMNPAMVKFVSELLSHHTTGSSVVPEASARPKPRPINRVDHDQIALDAALASSLQSPLSIKKGRKLRDPSPDWDPPDLGDILDAIKVDKETPPSGASAAKRKGKGKARASSPVPELEDITSDYEEAPPKKKKNTSPAKTISRSGGSSTAVKVEEPASPEPNSPPDGSLSSYLVRLGYPAVSANGISDSGAPLTMAQFQRVSRGDSKVQVDDLDADKEPASGEEVDTVFLEDIEVYRVYFNPKAKCGVFDVRLQAPSLRPTYLSLHPLPANRRILPSYDPNRNSLEDVDTSTGGRVNWEAWYNQNPRMLAANSVGAIVFEEAAPNFGNISRISPLRLNTRISAGSSSTYRLHIEDRIAICVSVICTTESHLVAPKRIGVKSERMRKWVSGVLHDQEWERFEAATCLLFHEQTMYSQITDKALSFQTMISPDPRMAQNASPAEQRSSRSVPSSMFSTASPSKGSSRFYGPSRSSASSMKTLLAHNDSVPVYDARKIVVDFNKDLGRLSDVLPLFPGEIPVGSYTVVGYTMSSYMANLSGTSDRVPHVGCNILWAIVCGTPRA
ncbi:hypothetical protein C8F04DRAFT_1189855 [Mycena alexandri]|uniref:Uncharacterized protein n=1 Tax=Mycena alexandri TaxID=1745969 RepID=A0AAD6SKD1_9AGAR|nr:hypothetical protein C8F04DRAFT_1189855 [Mycena alexandri]